MRKSTTHTLLMLAAFLPATPLFAQIGGTGWIQGVVSDPSGAVIPGASVTATNAATQVRSTRQTTEAGLYNISPLEAGEYSVTVTAGGFRTAVQEHVMVDALASVSLNCRIRRRRLSWD